MALISENETTQNDIGRFTTATLHHGRFSLVFRTKDEVKTSEIQKIQGMLDASETVPRRTVPYWTLYLQELSSSSVGSRFYVRTPKWNLFANDKVPRGQHTSKVYVVSTLLWGIPGIQKGSCKNLFPQNKAVIINLSALAPKGDA